MSAVSNPTPRRLAPRRLAMLLAAAVLSSLAPLLAPARAAAAPTRAQGAGPLADVLWWADTYKCGGLSRDELAAMILVPTYTETGADGPSVAPSPMTLSRYDTQDALYAFGTKGAYDKAFFHPGIGEWQWDSAGGWNLTAGTAIDTVTAAKQAAVTISSRYCASTQTDLMKRRAHAWAPWLYCTSDLPPSRCEAGYEKLLDNGVLNVNAIAGIESTGGMQWRTCDVPGVGVVSCGYVDPAKAQGLASFRVANYGPAPISAPFYVFESGGKEYRYWLTIDTGYPQAIRAFKNVTANARTGLTWQWSADGLCDRSAGRGLCQPQWSSVVGANFTATSTGRLASGRNLDGRMEVWAIGTDQKLYHSYQVVVNGPWSPWYTIGGVFPVGTSPSLGRNPDGRLEVFATGNDGQLWHSWQLAPNGSWSPLWPMGSAGGSVGATAVGTNADGRLEQFGRGADGRLWHSWQVARNGGWSAWVPFDGFTMDAASVPAVATNIDGRQQVVAMSAGGTLFTVAQVGPNVGWGAAAAFGGGPWVATKSPSIGRNADGRLEVFLAGDIYGVVYHAWQSTPGAGFGSPVAFAAASSATPTPRLDLAGRLNLLVVGPGGVLGNLRQIAPNGNWLGLYTVGGTGAATQPAVDLNLDGRLDLYASAASGDVLHAWQLTPPA